MAFSGPSPLRAKLGSVAALWSLALALSLLLVAAGRHWSEAPAAPAALVWTLLLAPSLLLAIWILSRWRLPPAGSPGGEGGESCD
ncbi:MAG: hypothetical protein ACOVNL_11670 [Prochlorococcaceae cyanobacterium]|jgi:hypothetical protein